MIHSGKATIVIPGLKSPGVGKHLHCRVMSDNKMRKTVKVGGRRRRHRKSKGSRKSRRAARRSRSAARRSRSAARRSRSAARRSRSAAAMHASY